MLLLELLFFAVANAALSHLLDYAIGLETDYDGTPYVADGRILGRYGRWLLAQSQRTGTLWAALWRPLGGCVVCTNVWQSVATFGLLPLPLGTLGGGYIAAAALAYVALSHIALRITQKALA